MKLKHILVTLLTLCLLLTFAACDKTGDPPVEDTTVETPTDAPTEAPQTRPPKPPPRHLRTSPPRRIPPLTSSPRSTARTGTMTIPTTPSTI